MILSGNTIGSSFDILPTHLRARKASVPNIRIFPNCPEITMGKNKTNPQKGPGQKHLHSRISFLYQAAKYFSSITDRQGAREQTAEKCYKTTSADAHCEAQIDERLAGNTYRLSRLCTSHLRGVSRRATIRLAPELKRTMCKRCDALLQSGWTSETYLENKSLGGSKPWADILVIKCNACSTQKRFPIHVQRQQRRSQRTKATKIADGKDGSIGAVG